MTRVLKSIDPTIRKRCLYVLQNEMRKLTHLEHRLLVACKDNVLLDLDERQLLTDYYKEAIYPKMYMVSSGYCGNDLLFWKEGDCGYTTDFKQAKLWSPGEAMDQAGKRDEDIAWPIWHLLEATRTTVESQALNCKHCYSGNKGEA